MDGQRRLAVGFGIDFLGSSYHKLLLAGVDEACRDADVDLVCFVTGRLDSPLEAEKSRNVLLKFLAGTPLDGVLLASSSVGSVAAPGTLECWARDLAPLPVGLIGNRFHNQPHPGILVPGDLEPLVAHLVEVHGHRRLAYLGGPPENAEALRRRERFDAAVGARGLVVPPAWRFQGDFRPESGRRAVDSLLQAPGERPQALVCANDAMAWGAMERMRERGLAPGWDLAVTGYDDIETSTFLGLTTIRQEFRWAAHQAATRLIDRVREGGSGDEVVLEEVPVFRESCGCTPGAGTCEEPSDTPGLVPFEAKLRRAGSLWIHHPETLVNEVHRLTEEASTGPEAPDRPALEYRAKAVVKEILTQSKLWAGASRDLRMDEINDPAEAIAACFRVADLDRVLAQELPALGIRRYLVGRFNDDKPHPTVRIDGSGGFGTPGETLPPGQALPEGWNQGIERSTLVVHALFQGSQAFGLAVFHHGARELEFYEQLRARIAAALKGCELVGSLQAHAAHLEEKVRERTADLSRELEERKRVEQEVRRKEEQIRELAMLVPGIVMELDDRFHITFVNEAGRSALELPPPRPGQPAPPLLDAVSPESKPQILKFLKDALRDPGHTGQTELHIQRPARSPLVMLVNVRAYGSLGHRRGLYLSAIDLNPLLDSAVKPDVSFHDHYPLSPRVREVLDLTLEGHTNRQIAERLGISENTVKVHMHNLYMATGTAKRQELFDLLREYQKRNFGYGSYLHSLLAGVMRS